MFSILWSLWKWRINLNLVAGYTAGLWWHSRHWSIRPGSRLWNFGRRIQKLWMLLLIVSIYILGGLRSVIQNALMIKARITGQNDDCVLIKIEIRCSLRSSHCLCFTKFWLLWGRHFRIWRLSSSCLSHCLWKALSAHSLSLLLSWIYLQLTFNVGHICCKKIDFIVVHRWRFYILIEIKLPLVLRLFRLEIHHHPKIWILSHRSLASTLTLDCELWVV